MSLKSKRDQAIMEFLVGAAPGPKNWNSCKISDDASNLTKGGLGNEESIHGGADY